MEKDTGFYHAAAFLPDPDSGALARADMDVNNLGASFQCSFITLLTAVRYKCIVVNPSGTNRGVLKGASRNWKCFQFSSSSIIFII